MRLARLLVGVAFAAGIAALACSQDPQPLEQTLHGTWYLRRPPVYESRDQLRVAIANGVIAHPGTGQAWGSYTVLDSDTIRLRLTTARTVIDQVLTVRVYPDGSMSWSVPDPDQDPAYILTRGNDAEYLHDR